MFCQDIIVHWKKINGQQANCPALASEIKPASFAILQQIQNSTGLSAKLTGKTSLCPAGDKGTIRWSLPHYAPTVNSCEVHQGAGLWRRLPTVVSQCGCHMHMQPSRFSQSAFRSVSPSFANHVSQVSQGFANTSFAVLRLFRKIRKVSQIQFFASFRK